MARAKKRREGLSLTGLAAQVISSVKVHKSGLCTANDCKFVLNNIVRVFPLGESHRWYHSHNSKLDGVEIQHDHVVPVNAIVEHLLDSNEYDVERVKSFLQTYLAKASITKDEHLLLGELGLAHCMPETWAFTKSTDGHILKRYAEARIQVAKGRLQK